MKCFRFAVPMLIFLVAGVAKADSISNFTITSAAAGAGPNGGTGDNAGLELFGPGGFHLSAFGGTSSYGFIGDTFSAGDSVGGFAMDWFGFSLAIGKTTFDPETVRLSLVEVFPLGALTVSQASCAPAMLVNGNDMSQPIHASAGSDDFVEFNFKIPRGTLCLYFSPIEGSPSLYEFSSANFFAPSTVVPEPSTLALMATGLTGVFGAIRRRKRRLGSGS
jgi:hypothetical protein